MDVPRCPKCGSKMTLRTARQGKYSGRQFWGCLRYPNCKGIINIDSKDTQLHSDRYNQKQDLEQHKITSKGEKVLRILGGIIVIALGIALAKGFDVVTDYAFYYGRKGSPSWIIAVFGIFAGYTILKGK